MADEEYEVWREVWKVTERRDGAIYKTEKVSEGWFDMEFVKANQSSGSDTLYVMGGDNCLAVAIRRKK